jgi:hypothetical protein
MYEIAIKNISSAKIEFYISVEYLENKKWFELDNYIITNQKEPIYEFIGKRTNKIIKFSNKNLSLLLFHENVKKHFRFTVFYFDPNKPVYFKQGKKWNKSFSISSSSSNPFKFCKQ